MTLTVEEAYLGVIVASDYMQLWQYFFEGEEVLYGQVVTDAIGATLPFV